MHSLKNPSFFRPASRPSSPSPAPPSRPDSGIGFERARPLHKLSLSTFRRPSPAPSPAPVTRTPAPLVQDGSYLEMLSLKLSEAVSKAFAQPVGQTGATDVLAGKRPLPLGRGAALGALIASELKAASENPHLHRAILRSLHRPFSVLLSNLSSLLVPLLSSPAFLNPPAPTVQFPNSNPTQLHALAISAFAGELLQTFEEFNLGTDSDPRGDGLKAVKEGLVSLVNRVVNPLVNGIKNELFPLLEALESSSTGNKTAVSGKMLTVHQSVASLQTIMPVYAKALTRYCSTPATQSILATFLISVSWRTLMAISHRPRAPVTPPSSPAIVPLKKRRGSPSTTPPITPPANRFTIKLPASRPPSPQNPGIIDTATTDACVMYDLLVSLPRPSLDSHATKLAGEAVDEAFEGLKALPALLQAAHSLPTRLHEGMNIDAVIHDLEALTTELPTLIALPVLLHVYEQGSLTISSILGLSEYEYRKSCLSGFGRADECAVVVGERVLGHIRDDHPTGAVLKKWLADEIAEAGV